MCLLFEPYINYVNTKKKKQLQIQKIKKSAFLHRFGHDRCRLLTILRRSHVKDRLRMLRILRRFFSDRRRIITILHWSFTTEGPMQNTEISKTVSILKWSQPTDVEQTTPFDDVPYDDGHQSMQLVPNNQCRMLFLQQ